MDKLAPIPSGIPVLDGTETHEDVPRLGQPWSPATMPSKPYDVVAVGYGRNGGFGNISACW